MDKRAEPGCESCIRRETCIHSADGGLCCMWQSKEPAPRGEDPNAAWRRGEDAPV